MEVITKEQKQAIKRLNSALKNAHEKGIFLAGMNSDLLYATKQCIDNHDMEKTSSIYKSRGDYCDVARCNQYSDEGSGHLYSENYEDSGGW